MNIQNATPEDVDTIFGLYRIASDFQRRKKTVVIWPDFDPGMVEQEIREHRQFKMVLNDEVACIWAITFSDAQIWEERNSDAALYIHRIATNPKFRGRNFVGMIVDWARDFVKAHEKRYIRLDTIGNNTGLIKHYTNAGFDFLGMFELKEVDALPPHYKNGPACLFEIDTQIR
ncbi:MAG: GNAT family N-acetyltransferase [Maribacter sp.]